MNERVSLFIRHKKGTEAVVPALKKIRREAGDDIRATIFDMDFGGDLRNLNIKADYSWNYLKDEDCRHIDDFFFRELAKNWFLFKTPREWGVNEGKKTLLGRCTEYNFFRSNHSLIKYIAVIKKIFAEYAPTRVLVFEDAPYLVNIVKLFGNKYDFKVFKVDPQRRRGLVTLRNLTGAVKSFIKDSAILLLDFFILRLLFMSKKYENKIIIDHRLYERFAHTGLRDKLLVCFFEKGLRPRLDMVRRGLLYFPLRFASCLDPFLRRSRLRGRRMVAAPFRVRRLTAELDRLNKTTAGGDLFEYEGIVFWDAIKGYISRALAYSLPGITANIDTFKKFARVKGVKLIIMRHDIKETERNMIFAARPAGVTTVVIQHGILGDPNMNITVGADTSCVWGERSIDWYKKFGFSDNGFVVTGNPAYDELFGRFCANRQEATRQKVCRNLNLNPAKKIVTFLTMSNFLFASCFKQPNEMGLITKYILEAIRPSPDIQLIIKVHPYDEDLDRYHEAVSRCGMAPNAAVVKDYSVFDILEASDLVITIDSSSGLEALILDKPLIECRLGRRKTLVPYADSGVAIGVENADELGRAIKDGLFNKEVQDGLHSNRDKFIFDYAYKIDGQALKRIEEVVCSLIDKRITR